MKRIILWPLLLIVFHLGAQEKLSLQQAIETAFANNLSVQQQQLRVEQAEINRKQARANMLPNLNGNFNYGWQNGRNIDPFLNVYVNQQLQGSNISANSEWLIFNGFQVQRTIQQATLNRSATELELQQSRETLAVNVIMAYLMVLVNEDLLTNLRAQIEVTKEQIRRFDVLVKEGARGAFQLSDLKGQLANEEVAIVNAQNSLDLARVSLCQLMNVPVKRDLLVERSEAVMPDTVYAGSPDEVFGEAKKHLAAVRAGDLRVEAARKGVQAERGGYFPRLGFYGNLFSNFSSAASRNIGGPVVDVASNEYVVSGGNRLPVFKPQQQFTSEAISYGSQMKNNIGSSFGVAAQIPLFNNFRTRYRVQQARVLERSAQVDRSVLEQNLRQQVEQAWANMEASYKRYRQFREQQVAFTESFRANEIRFNMGAINSFEYLSAKNNLDRSTLNLTQVRYEYIFRTMVLDYLQGRRRF